MKCMYCNSEWQVSSVVSTAIEKCPFCGKSLVSAVVKLDTLEAVLAEIMDSFGVDALQNGKYLLAYFSDLAPTLVKEKRILSYLVECNGHNIILNGPKDNPAQQKLCVEKVILKLSDELLVDEKMAQRVCYAFHAAAFGKKKQNEEAKLKLEDSSSPAKKGNCTSRAYKMSAEEQYEKGQKLYNSAKISGHYSDYRQAFDWYKKAANRGHAFAQCAIGYLCREGLGVAKNEEQAFSWFMKSAQSTQSCPRGKFFVGRCYEVGTGVDADVKEAVRWYAIAAELGDVYAQTNLGVLYELGNGVDKNYAEAVRLFSLAADQGDALAKCKLGLLYKEGLGVRKNLDVAFDLINQSAGQGEPLGQLELGYWYWRGDVCKSNHAEAFKWFKASAAQGNANAQERLGYCYENGRGVSRNVAMAFYWYLEAAHNGLASAMRTLGDCYAEGCHVDRDQTKAISWYKKAVNQGDALAMVDLGNCYFEGNGVSRDDQQALELYINAYNKGEPFGLIRLFDQFGSKDRLTEDECQRIASFVQKDDDGIWGILVDHMADSLLNVAVDLIRYPKTKATGISWIKKCADAGSARAQFWLGETYRLGDDLPKDKEKSVYWYEQAATQGHQEAKNRLKQMKNGILGYLFS